jgi:phage FluMu gp28-like protein
LRLLEGFRAQLAAVVAFAAGSQIFTLSSRPEHFFKLSKSGRHCSVNLQQRNVANDQLCIALAPLR